jgi:hypothetical protein
MFFLVSGIILLARFAYSGLVARLAVVAAAFVVLGLLLMLAEFAQQLSA